MAKKWVEEMAKRFRKQAEVLEEKANARDVLSTEEKNVFLRGCWDTPSSEEPHCHSGSTQDASGNG